jgi:PhoH-like ATPase
MKKVMIIDTNVLLENPKAYLTFKKNDVVIPYKVIEELEKHKTTIGEVGMNARDCSRTLSKLLDSQTTTTLKSGVKLEVGTKLFVVSINEFEDKPLTTIETGDDHILAVCVGIQKEWKSYTPILVSNDMLLRIRANSFGIKCEKYDSNTTVSNTDDLYTGYKTIEVSEEIIARYWEENKGLIFSVTPKELTKEKLYPNDYILLTCSADTKKKPYALLRVKETNKKKELYFVNEAKLSNLKPQNVEQTMALDMLMDPSVALVTLSGIAGTGKTLCAVGAALEQILEKKLYKQLLVIRPIHPVGKDIGFLKGDKKEKLEPWIAPIKDNMKFLLGKKETVDWMIERGTVEIEAMTFIRGRSIAETFILVDEAQNCSPHEIKTILTRLGKGSKVVLTGDIDQIDRHDVDSLTNGLSVVAEKFKEYGIASHLSLKEGCRSDLATLAAKIL